MRNEAKRQAKLARKHARNKAYERARNLGTYQSFKQKNINKFMKRLRLAPKPTPPSSHEEKHMSLKQEFYKKYLPGFWNRILFWFLFHKVKRAKKMFLWESLLDKSFMDTEMGKELSYDEIPDRKILAEERAKPDDKQDNVKIREIEDKISLSKAVKAMYNKNNANIEEVSHYLHMLEIWRNKA